MHVLELKTPLLTTADPLVPALLKAGTWQPNDIVVLSSKIVALTEGAAIDLGRLEPTAEAQALALPTVSPAFAEAVLQETRRLHGRVLPGCPYALLTALKPSGSTGTLLVPNAGLDQSNIERGFAIGWPHDPPASAQRIRSAISAATGCPVAVIIGDSSCHMGRAGVAAIALACAGIDPLLSMIGTKDLHDRPLSITQEAIADQLATAANAVMGNAAQATPAAIIRGHGLPLSEYCGWVPTMDPQLDLFSSLMRPEVLSESV